MLKPTVLKATEIQPKLYRKIERGTRTHAEGQKAEVMWEVPLYIAKSV